MDFGVPQIRKRVFFIAVRNDINCKQKDLANTPLFYFKKYKHVKWGEIEENDGYRPLTKYMMDWWVKRKPTDRTFEQITKREGKLYSLFGTNLLKKKNMAPTITTRNINVLYDQPRLMNDTELIKCGSFPLDYDFLDTKPLYSIGMCVPPLMMARIVNDLTQQIEF
jgi:DNA (cytosine-5)-methyltransferase 1